MSSSSARAPSRPDSFRGVLAGCSAHVLWGVAVLYWRLLAELPAVTILAHRMIWSCLFVFILLRATGRGGEVRAALAERRTMLTLCACACILSANWGIFLWAVNRGNVIETSLGYFITPLLNVFMGRALLGERLSRLQAAAILLALAGVLWSMVGYGHVPWVAFLLALSFAVFGYLQKTVRVEAAPSLFIETVVLLPFALMWLSLAHPGEMGGMTGHGALRPLLLTGTCLFTALPLVLFSYAARHITLATVGIVQYLSPSINFLLAVTLMGERIKPGDMVTFPLIWAALALYTWDALRSMRRLKAGPPPARGDTAPEHPPLS
ncbi:MAG: EamA family transporter RarD [Desulfovibrionaceae bacterium]|nr:EamA family transporter RarD [Desulfovibrionaceae bacterium]